MIEMMIDDDYDNRDDNVWMYDRDYDDDDDDDSHGDRDDNSDNRDRDHTFNDLLLLLQSSYDTRTPHPLTAHRRRMIVE